MYNREAVTLGAEKPWPFPTVDCRVDGMQQDWSWGSGNVRGRSRRVEEVSKIGVDEKKG